MALVHPFSILPPSSPLVASRPWTLVFAHDPRSRACDVLLGGLIAQARPGRGPCHVEEVGSLEATWVALDRARRVRLQEDTLILACLDLPPAPRAAMTVFGWARSLGLPAIAVTHGRRWLRSADGAAAAIPSLSPAADAEEIARALVTVLRPEEDVEAPPESFPGRPSWLG